MKRLLTMLIVGCWASVQAQACPPRSFTMVEAFEVYDIISVFEFDQVSQPKLVEDLKGNIQLTDKLINALEASYRWYFKENMVCVIGFYKGQDGEVRLGWNHIANGRFIPNSITHQRFQVLASIVRSGEPSEHHRPLLRWLLDNLSIPQLKGDAVRELENWTVKPLDSTKIEKADMDWYERNRHFNFSVAGPEEVELIKQAFEKSDQYWALMTEAALEVGMGQADVSTKLLNYYHQILANNYADREQDEELRPAQYAYWGGKYKNHDLRKVLHSILPEYGEQRTFFEQLLLFDTYFGTPEFESSIGDEGFPLALQIRLLTESVNDLPMTVAHDELQSAYDGLETQDEGYGCTRKIAPIRELADFEAYIAKAQEYVNMCDDPRIRTLTGKRLIWECSDQSAFAMAESFAPDAVEVTTFPSPSNGQFTLRATMQSVAPLVIRIFSSTGAQVLSEELSPNLQDDKAIFTKEINLANKPAGVYIITLNQGNKVLRQQVSVIK